MSNWEQQHLPGVQHLNVWVNYVDESIALGARATIISYNQLVAAPNIASFTMSRLTASPSSIGILLKFEGSTIAPSARAYNTVSAIDTTITAIDTPYAMSWNSRTAITFDSSSSPVVCNS